MALNDIEEYILRSIAVLGGIRHSQITVGNVTLPKAVLSTVKIFAVQIELVQYKESKRPHQPSKSAALVNNANGTCG